MNRKIIVCLIVAGLFYAVAAYIFMWPPVVWEYPVARATSSANVCLNNLRQIDGAINEWALEHQKTNGTPVTWDDIKPYIKLNSHGEISQCDKGGTYTITIVGAPPICSLGTNSAYRLRLHYFFWEYNPFRYHRLP